MIINDKIYGQVKVEEPILVKLIKSSSILRLKSISQFGIPDEFYHFKGYSRYEHSLGVMILLGKLGASLEEQVAGLLHDVSHLAFSHVADWVFARGAEGNEDYHDNLQKHFLEKTEIPKILERNGFSLEKVTNKEIFSLLKKEIPDLCADRLDYSLREFKDWLNPKAVKPVLRSVVNCKNEIVFTNQKAAANFARNFLQLQIRHWASPLTIRKYFLFSKALKFALRKKIISKQDFFEDEIFILKKIKKSNHRTIVNILEATKNNIYHKNKDGKVVVKKFRYVDPKILVNDILVRLSEINPKFKKLSSREKKKNRKGILV